MWLLCFNRLLNQELIKFAIMGLFWRRKSADEFVSLGLNEPAKPGEAPAVDTQPEKAKQAVESPSLMPPSSGGAPTPMPVETVGHAVEKPRERADAERSDPVREKPVVSRSPFATSVLGLNLSMEELKAQEEALEQEFSARFRRAVAATRDSLSDKLDTVFAGRKQIDDELLDQLEEVLIAADIGVNTTLAVLETVRRGIARKQINDLDALKSAIKNELLTILKTSERQGIASETSVPETVSPYVMMIVGVNGVGKTTTIGKLAQRIKAEGNDVLICAADTFRAAASDQLAIWADRTGVPLIQQKQGTDPAAV